MTREKRQCCAARLFGDPNGRWLYDAVPGDNVRVRFQANRDRNDVTATQLINIAKWARSGSSMATKHKIATRSRLG